MRRNVPLVLLTLLLFATVALAQNAGTSGQSVSPSVTSSSSQNQTTTTTTTTSQTTTSGPSRSVEGCIVKEASDFFLVPRAGTPILLQPITRVDLSEHKGHKVKVQGTLTSTAASTATATAGGAKSTASTSGQTPTAVGQSGTATGTGNELHQLADRQLVIDSVTHISDSCPVNWNPKFPAAKR